MIKAAIPSMRSLLRSFTRQRFSFTSILAVAAWAWARRTGCPPGSIRALAIRSQFSSPSVGRRGAETLIQVSS